MLQDRNRTGALPDKLPDYGEIALDPFTDKPLHYRKVGNGFILYSEGPDGDQGGVAQSGSTPPPYDFVWRID